MKAWFVLVVVVLMAMVHGGCSKDQPVPDPRQQTAVEAVMALNGWVDPIEPQPGEFVSQVHLEGTDTQDDDLEALAPLNGLEELNLAETKITNEGLAHLQPLTTLQRLNLSGTRITDEGLAQLKSLPQLRELTLIETRITDKGLEHLKQLSSLRLLDLYDSRCTEKGIKAFESARPDVKVYGLAPPATEEPEEPVAAEEEVVDPNEALLEQAPVE